jgi:hypothetical protein
MKRLLSAYKRFHGREPRYSKEVRFTPPEGFVRLGEVVAIEYACDKEHGGGDGKMAVYRHKFDRGAMLLADTDMRRQLYIIGSKIVVTSSGITH